MRLAVFRRHTDEPHLRVVGLVLGQGEHLRVHPFDAGADLVELLAETPEWRESRADVAAAEDGLTLDEIVLLPPVYPTAMRDFLTFEAHVDGMERGHGNPGPPAEWYESPVFLFMAPHAVTGPYDDVAMPPDTERLDFELEIAAVICRDVRNATVEEARAAIGGYCVMNDWSARDIQGREMRLKLGPSKGKDFATTIGPWVVTADEFDVLPRRRRLPRPRDDRQRQRRAGRRRPLRPHGLVVRAAGLPRLPRLVGQGRRGPRLRHLRLRVPSPRAGAAPVQLTPPPLQVGDVVEMTIEGIGTISNRVVASSEDVPSGPGRPAPQPRGGLSLRCPRSPPSTRPPASS